jgi:hypothetical protein
MTRRALPVYYETQPVGLIFNTAAILSATGAGAPSCYRAATPSNCTCVRDSSIQYHGYSTLALRNTNTSTFSIQVRLDIAGDGGTSISQTVPAGTNHIIIPIYFPSAPQADNQTLAISIGNGTVNTNLENFTLLSAQLKQGWNEIMIPVNSADISGLKTAAGGFTHGADTGTGCDFTPGQAIQYLQFSFREATATGGGFNIGPIQFGRKTRAKVLFSFDECTAEMTTVAEPALTAIGANCLCAIPGTIASGAAGYVRAQTLVNTYGWEVCNHSKYHLEYTGSQALGAGSIEADWALQQATLESYGLLNDFTRKLFVFPENKTNHTVRAIMQSLGVVMARGYRNLWVYPGIYGVDNIMECGAHDLSNSYTLAQAKASIDECIRRGTTLMLYGHTLTGSSATGWAAADFEALVAYIGLKKRQGLIDTPTWQQWYEGLSKVRA